eukprot:CAMPEP_0206405094 /NCGR_PEP_ID=MMETSP0294-20121207/28848_1 /ASSEMBLY_ACC=CAM_ASM_000327 /TAXON_ID=39354 /ORGANISM="Heterosigma akashiwo, Strain CCMP2393" /LENGTH=45 /DNA_ID= /DNA_START= /DNA_END= /DNA_ORIENTATION=
MKHHVPLPIDERASAPSPLLEGVFWATGATPTTGAACSMGDAGPT